MDIDKNKSENVRIGFPLRQSLTAFDPAKIEFADESVFSDILYSGLLTRDINNKIIGQLVKEFFWENNILKLKLFKGLKNSQGGDLTNNDVIFSLKRTMFLNSNTNGKLSDYICARPLESVASECLGLYIKDDYICLKPTSLKYKDLLMHLLTSTDLKIIPTDSIDRKTLKIINLKMTTGPFFLEKDYDGNSIVFSKNSHFISDNNNYPNQISLIKTNFDPTRDEIEKNNLDVVSSFISLTPNNGFDEKYIEAHYPNRFQTSPMMLENLSFSLAYIKKTTDTERLSIAKIFEDFVQRAEVHTKCSEAVQYFPNYDTGGLSAEELHRIQIKRQSAKSSTNPKIRVMTPERYIKRWNQLGLNKKYPSIEFVKNGEKFDLLLWEIDSSFNSDITLLEYVLSLDIFSFDDKFKDEWLSSFRLLDSIQRVKKIRELHFQVLDEVRIYPITSFPLQTYSKKDLILDLSSNVPNTRFHRIFVK